MRAAWFIENATWDLESARSGEIQSLLQRLDHPIPMVATADIANAAAELLNETWSGVRIIELEGPQRYSANDIAKGFSLAPGRPVRASGYVGTAFCSQGMKHPIPRVRMIDGFN